jgi:hypothetical protein
LHLDAKPAAAQYEVAREQVLQEWCRKEEYCIQNSQPQIVILPPNIPDNRINYDSGQELYQYLSTMQDSRSDEEPIGDASDRPGQ